MANVAILGYGVVGSGVADVLTENVGQIGRKAEENIRLKYILVRHDYPDSPYRDRQVFDFAQIENDPEVDIVVETIGGLGMAKEYTERALRAGKSVVTANKELVAESGYDLLQLAEKYGVSYLFEASVGGGIPIIRPLNQCLAANEIEEICGILNGTTNYILTRMIRAGLSFEAALKEAQENGYAESDPTADVEGYDACRKICILSSLAFGRHIYPSQVLTQGITGVTLADVAYAESCGRKIKLLGRAIRMENGALCVYVSPHLVNGENPLAGVEDVFNAITVRGNAVGDVMFYGRGAGKRPTASAVVADVMDAAKHRKGKKYLHWGQGGEHTVTSTDPLENSWYVRMDASAEAVKNAFGEVTFLARAGAPAGEISFLTSSMNAPALANRLAEVGQTKSLLRVLD